MKHTVIGTAGHIDHGKTLLLKALTGIDADRLPEEKERGMTIDLGFVFYSDDVTIIDVPGHEKFIKNMLAGVSTIDIVVLVIAADDGIMPQTREHFEILKLLDIQQGIIALTKTDLVDEEWLELIKDDIREFVKGTFLEDAPIQCVSGLTGEGVPEFKEILDNAIENAPERQDKGIFRLWIDRVFVLKGIGTIVAGTVLSGALKPGDKLELLPVKKDLRVRKLQVHNEDVDTCRIGERIAVNLTGVETDELERGYLLAKPKHFEPTFMINAKLYLLKDAKPLENRTRVRLHIGSRELLARVALLEKKKLEPGNSTLVQLRLEEQIAVEIGDAYIIRSYSPANTIGGGTIVEVHPKKLKYLPDEELKKLEKLESADPEQIILHHMANNPLGLETVNKLAREIALKSDDVKGIAEKLLNDEKIEVIDNKTDFNNTGFVLTEHFGSAEDRVMEFLKTYHRQFPYLSGIKKSELKNKLFADVESVVYDSVLNSLKQPDKITVKDETVSVAGHEIVFTEKQEKIKDRIENLYLEAKYVTPSIGDIETEFPHSKKKEIQNIITGMIGLGILVEIKTEVEKPAVFHSKNVREAEKILVDTLKINGEIKLFEFRELLDSTRKFTTPLLIYFDRKGITERDGDIRRLRSN
ncbi:MAG: selenocysteine-specific translation elongation factor [bacterium]|nr:selenocysteine-specific translation elongation factor [bacterium]